MKRQLCLIVSLCMVLIVGMPWFSVFAGEEPKLTLSDMSDEECISFLQKSGVAIPDIYEQVADCIPFVRMIISKTEMNPTATFYFNIYKLQVFAYDIQNAVNEYYNVLTAADARTRSVNALQDNELFTSWNESYVEYNCYAYAIGQGGCLHPGEVAWINAGNDPLLYEYNASANLVRIVQLVKNDLESLGYIVGSVTITMPEITVTQHTHLICIRKDTDITLDFHFMKLGMDGNWYHKPGATIPLRYLYEPEYSRIWVSEGYHGATNTYFRDEDYTYESTIHFIEYTTPHIWENVYCGSDQHIRRCAVCSETSGLATSCLYLNGICRICGHVEDGISIG